MEQRFIDVLTFYAKNDPNYYSIPKLPKHLTCKFVGKELYDLVGARYSALFEQNKKATGYYKLSEAGMDIIIPIIKSNNEQAELNTVSNAKMWYETENAKRIYENHEIDQKRIEKAEKRASNAELYTKWSMIAALISGIAAVLALLFSMK